MTEIVTDILLATYNGARYLPELLESLDRQSDQAWRLVARDDGSSDDTVELLKQWGRDKGARFLLIEDGRKGQGASGNFNALLQACSARYFMLCDQDDVWLPDKVARLKAAMRRAEAADGAETPIIVHSDLIVADAALRPVADSFWAFQGLRLPPEDAPWKLLTLQNVVTGCAMIGNAALLHAALPVSDQAKMHDWWLALVCALTGRVIHDEKPSVLYRQHGTNTLGAKRWSFWRDVRLALTFPFKTRRKAMRDFARTQAQAGAALRHLEQVLTPEQNKFLRGFSSLRHSNLITRRRFLRRHRLYVHGLMRNIGLALLK